jgi:hypothetical protein
MLEQAGWPASDVDGYRVIRHLADTTHGSTFVAHDRRLDRAVLLRLLPADRNATGEILQAARALSRISHPAVCAVHRVREAGERMQYEARTRRRRRDS